MLILLPPSEGKAATDAGAPFSIDALSLPELNRTRVKVRDALVKLCSGRETRAREVLGLSTKKSQNSTATAISPTRVPCRPPRFTPAYSTQRSTTRH